MIQEKWLPVKGYEQLYHVSSSGRVKSLGRTEVYKNSKRCRKPRILKPHMGTSTYYAVTLCKNMIQSSLMVHRLVAEVFIPNPDNKPQVNHINGIKTDNRVENLEWVTAKENMQHARKIGLCKPVIQQKGSENRMAKRVARLDEQGIILCVYGCAKEASVIIGYGEQAISVAANSGYRCDGNHWKYITEEEYVINKEKIYRSKKRIPGERKMPSGEQWKNTKKVARLNSNNEVIEIYHSAIVASMKLGYNKGAVTHAINKNKTCAGSKWKYVEEIKAQVLDKIKNPQQVVETAITE